MSSPTNAIVPLRLLGCFGSSHCSSQPNWDQTPNLTCCLELLTASRGLFPSRTCLFNREVYFLTAIVYIYVYIYFLYFVVPINITFFGSGNGTVARREVKNFGTIFVPKKCKKFGEPALASQYVTRPRIALNVISVECELSTGDWIASLLQSNLVLKNNSILMHNGKSHISPMDNGRIQFDLSLNRYIHSFYRLLSN